MKKYIIILFALIGSFAYSQYDFQEICLACAEAEGFYCGDDPTNWTQYSPNGCVQNSWINDGWEDCVDAADENAEGPTLSTECLPPPPPPCDTIYITEYATIFDTIPEYIYEIIVDTVEVEVFFPEYIYITDTLWMEGALDTLFVDVIEYIDVEEAHNCLIAMTQHDLKNKNRY